MRENISWAEIMADLDLTLRPISVSALRERARDVMEGVRIRGEHYIVNRYRQPIAVIIGAEEYCLWLMLREQYILEGGDEEWSGVHTQRHKQRFWKCGG